ncbi:hypothetical protein P9112_013678 [Eukaryota sp. TZLM1-RC]
MKENPAFANFLIDLKDSSSAVLINQIPQIYGLFLNDDQWTTAMRMRCYLWPCNLPNDLFCKCGAGLTLSHLFNCNRYISYRSTLHDAVRDQIHAMCNSYHIESFVEPLLRSLDINESVRDSEYGKRRADVVVPSGCLQEKCLEKCSIRSIPLDDSELYKRKKYANPLKELKHVRHVDYQICPFAISLYGRLGKTALNFIDDFENLVKKRMNKRFDRRLWLNRIVFTIFKSIPKMISKALMSVSAHYENIAAVRFRIKLNFKKNPLKELKHVRRVDYQICPFAISLYGRLGKTALNFIDDFENLVKKRMSKRFDRRLWLNRIVFTIFKSIPKMISKALMSVSAHYENIAAVRFDGVEACFEDIDF